MDESTRALCAFLLARIERAEAAAEKRDEQDGYVLRSLLGRRLRTEKAIRVLESPGASAFVQEYAREALKLEAFPDAPDREFRPEWLPQREQQNPPPADAAGIHRVELDGAGGVYLSGTFPLRSGGPVAVPPGVSWHSNQSVTRVRRAEGSAGPG